MKIKFTNGNGDESDITIKGKCKITDYDTRTKLPDGKDLTVEVDGENVSIMNGTELKQDSQTVEMNSNKYSIFTAIAGMDGDGSNLTEKDIAKAKKSFVKQDGDGKVLAEFGVTEIRYDSHAGVATIVIGEKELLRIDFQTWRERMGVRIDSSELYEEPELPLMQSSLSKNDYDKTRMRAILDENGKPIKEIIYKSYKSYFEALAQAESSGDPRNMSVSKKDNIGYAGLYQIGEQALADIGVYPRKSKYDNKWKHAFLPNKYGVKSLEDFKNNPDKQKLIFIDIMKKNWQYIHSEGLDRYIGKTINGHLITESGLLAGAHLVGVGKLKEFILSQGKKDPIDGNRKKVSEYIDKFAGHDMSSITGTPFGTKAKDIVYENVEYTVVSGDSLFKIAKYFNTTIDRIKKASKLKNDNLSIGQKLTVPQGKEV